MFSNISKEKQEFLTEIKYLYGLNQDAGNYLESYFAGKQEDLERLQEILVEFVLNDQILVKYKPYWKYRKSFLKKIISICEKENAETNNLIYESYIQIINDPEANSSPGQDKTYFILFFSKVISLRS